MPYRRFRRRRRFGRKRAYRRKWSRKVPRKYSNDGKRFFKLTTSDPATTTAGGIIDNTYTDTPVGYADWNNISALFDNFRVCAIKVKFIPNKPNDLSSATPYTPIYIIHDKDSTSPPGTTQGIIEYENMRVKNLFQPWTYYKKFAKQSATGITGQVLLPGGYKDVGMPNASQAIFIRSESGLQTNTQYGRYITTLYIVCKNRR